MSFEGKWNLDKSENFEEYMKEVGVGLITRKAAANLKTTLIIKVEGNKWTCLQQSTFKNSELVFVLDEEFEETTPDGRKVFSKVVQAGDKLVHTQKKAKNGDVESTIERFLEGDRLVTILKAGSVVCRREYTRA